MERASVALTTPSMTRTHNCEHSSGRRLQRLVEQPPSRLQRLELLMRALAVGVETSHVVDCEFDSFSTAPSGKCA